MNKKAYLTITLLAYAVLTVVLVALPRTTYSELEKRDLKKFPTFSTNSLFSGQFTREVSEWFSDSEPFRDQFMHLSMLIDEAEQLHVSDNQVKFHASEQTSATEEEDSEDENVPDEIIQATAAINKEITAKNTDSTTVISANDDNNKATVTLAQTDDEPEKNVDPKRLAKAVSNEATANENAKIANAGIIITGSGPTTRAMMAFGGNSKTGTRYANVVNLYQKTFGDKANVYCMVIPTAIEYYCPEKAKKRSKSQVPTINNIHSRLNSEVKVVNIHDELANHVDEDIFLRTDHHWSPLGGYYAAKEFAKVADVPFRDLDSYEEKRVKRYVGSMYGYSKDISVKQNPEDFVYHVPRNVTFTTTYTLYTLDSKYRITGESKPFKGAYFVKYRDGSGGAYCTFMGGDCKITHIKTSTDNGRRLLVLKDSFGNTIPGYLFYSFEDIHIVDFRYFTKNMVDYVNKNNITDILFANNIFLLASSANCRNYERFLVQ